MRINYYYYYRYLFTIPPSPYVITAFIFKPLFFVLRYLFCKMEKKGGMPDSDAPLPTPRVHGKVENLEGKKICSTVFEPSIWAMPWNTLR